MILKIAIFSFLWIFGHNFEIFLLYAARYFKKLIIRKWIFKVLYFYYTTKQSSSCVFSTFLVFFLPFIKYILCSFIERRRRKEGKRKFVAATYSSIKIQFFVYLVCIVVKKILNNQKKPNKKLEKINFRIWCWGEFSQHFFLRIIDCEKKFCVEVK